MSRDGCRRAPEGATDQDIDGKASPVDVTGQLREPGIHVRTDIADILELIRVN